MEFSFWNFAVFQMVNLPVVTKFSERSLFNCYRHPQWGNFRRDELSKQQCCLATVEVKLAIQISSEQKGISTKHHFIGQTDHWNFMYKRCLITNPANRNALVGKPWGLGNWLL
jgi:hypothetical protein